MEFGSAVKSLRGPGPAACPGRVERFSPVPLGREGSEVTRTTGGPDAEPGADSSDSGDSLFLTQSTTPLRSLPRVHAVAESVPRPAAGWAGLGGDEDGEDVGQLTPLTPLPVPAEADSGDDERSSHDEDSLSPGKEPKTRRKTRVPRRRNSTLPFVTELGLKSKNIRQVFEYSGVGGFFKYMRRVCKKAKHRNPEDGDVDGPFLEDSLLLSSGTEEEAEEHGEDRADVRIVDAGLFIQRFHVKNRQVWTHKSMSRNKKRHKKLSVKGKGCEQNSLSTCATERESATVEKSMDVGAFSPEIVEDIDLAETLSADLYEESSDAGIPMTQDVSLDVADSGVAFNLNEDGLNFSQYSLRTTTEAEVMPNRTKKMIKDTSTESRRYEEEDVQTPEIIDNETNTEDPDSEVYHGTASPKENTCEKKKKNKRQRGREVLGISVERSSEGENPMPTCSSDVTLPESDVAEQPPESPAPLLQENDPSKGKAGQTGVDDEPQIRKKKQVSNMKNPGLESDNRIDVAFNLNEDGLNFSQDSLRISTEAEVMPNRTKKRIKDTSTESRRYEEENVQTPEIIDNESVQNNEMNTEDPDSEVHPGASSAKENKPQFDEATCEKKKKKKKKKRQQGREVLGISVERSSEGENPMPTCSSEVTLPESDVAEQPPESPAPLLQENEPSKGKVGQTGVDDVPQIRKKKRVSNIDVPVKTPKKPSVDAPCVPLEGSPSTRKRKNDEGLQETHSSDYELGSRSSDASLFNFGGLSFLRKKSKKKKKDVVLGQGDDGHFFKDNSTRIEDKQGRIDMNVTFHKNVEPAVEKPSQVPCTVMNSPGLESDNRIDVAFNLNEDGLNFSQDSLRTTSEAEVMPNRTKKKIKDTSTESRRYEEEDVQTPEIIDNETNTEDPDSEVHHGASSPKGSKPQFDEATCEKMKKKKRQRGREVLGISVERSSEGENPMPTCSSDVTLPESDVAEQPPESPAPLLQENDPSKGKVGQTGVDDVPQIRKKKRVSNMKNPGLESENRIDVAFNLNEDGLSFSQDSLRITTEAEVMPNRTKKKIKDTSTESRRYEEENVQTPEIIDNESVQNNEMNTEDPDSEVHPGASSAKENKPQFDEATCEKKKKKKKKKRQRGREVLGISVERSSEGENPMPTCSSDVTLPESDVAEQPPDSPAPLLQENDPSKGKAGQTGVDDVPQIRKKKQVSNIDVPVKTPKKPSVDAPCVPLEGSPSARKRKNDEGLQETHSSDYELNKATFQEGATFPEHTGHVFQFFTGRKETYLAKQKEKSKNLKDFHDVVFSSPARKKKKKKKDELERSDQDEMCRKEEMSTTRLELSPLTDALSSEWFPQPRKKKEVFSSEKTQSCPDGGGSTDQCDDLVVKRRNKRSSGTQDGSEFLLDQDPTLQTLRTNQEEIISQSNAADPEEEPVLRKKKKKDLDASVMDVPTVENTQKPSVKKKKKDVDASVTNVPTVENTQKPSVKTKKKKKDVDASVTDVPTVENNQKPSVKKKKDVDASVTDVPTVENTQKPSVKKKKKDVDASVTNVPTVENTQKPSVKTKKKKKDVDASVTDVPTVENNQKPSVKKKKDVDASVTDVPTVENTQKPSVKKKKDVDASVTDVPTVENTQKPSVKKKKKKKDVDASVTDVPTVENNQKPSVKKKKKDVDASVTDVPTVENNQKPSVKKKKKKKDVDESVTDVPTVENNQKPSVKKKKKKKDVDESVTDVPTVENNQKPSVKKKKKKKDVDASVMDVPTVENNQKPSVKKKKKSVRHHLEIFLS
ncbi:phoenix isoform X2 [Denticeps clupeoides]|uniref:phoenix isoform X2 n=1 Tax=Denticeps clupeoides TaxID=299321 RepID=UPI0010A383B4|nr:titin-like isoform X2 [Denticeps clupeoides]